GRPRPCGVEYDRTLSIDRLAQGNGTNQEPRLMQARSRVTLNGWRLALIAAFGFILPLQAAAPPTKGGGRGITPSAVQEDAWKKAPKKAVPSAEIDELISKELKKAGLEPAPLTTDEQFVRRVYLDLWGKPPSVEQIRAFVEDKDANKRAKLIDKLLEGDA